MLRENVASFVASIRTKPFAGATKLTQLLLRYCTRVVMTGPASAHPCKQ